MTRKEFIESVRLRRSLREWAATQPGYVPPVTAADVETVMAKIRPQLKKANRNKRLHPAIKSKIGILANVKIIKKPKPKNKLPISKVEVVVKTNPNPRRIAKGKATTKSQGAN